MKGTGLKKQSDRVSIAKWDRQQAANKYKQGKESEERNLQFIRDDATIKANSGLPAKINNPDTRIAHTADVDLPKIKGAVPKMSEATEVYTMAGAGTSTPIQDLRRLYTSYPEYGDASGWKKKSGTVYAKYHHYVVHWYENTKGVPAKEIKIKGQNKCECGMLEKALGLTA